MTEKFKQTTLDKVIGYFSPETGVKRLHARARLSMAGGYKSGDRDRKAFRGWKMSHGSADAETLPYLDALRSDSRDLLRNSALACGAVNTVVTNVIGTGLRPQSSVDRELLITRLGLNDAQIDAFEAAAEREFKIWAGRDCDASRISTFTGLQSLVFRSALESGDIFAIRRMLRRPGRRHALALQMVEADRVANPQGSGDTATLAAGVERDTYGAPMAYHVLRRHPGDTLMGQGSSRETDRIGAFFENGEWQVLHVFQRRRPQQTRGVPYLSPVIESLKQLDRYSEAEIMAAVISAMFTVFIKTEDGGGLAPADGQQQYQKNDEYRLGAGAILDLRADESIETANPGRPNTSYGIFVEQILREIGAALEVPFELLIKHFTASYSASQAAFMEAWKFFRDRRVWMVDIFCQPVWEAVITESVASGYIEAPGFFSDPLIRAAYLGAEWIGPPRGMIDIKKEAEANEIFERHGWKSNSAITAELTGGDWSRNHYQRTKEHEKLRASGMDREAEKQEEKPENKEETEESEKDDEQS